MTDSRALLSAASAIASHRARLEASEKSTATRMCRKAEVVLDSRGLLNSATDIMTSLYNMDSIDLRGWRMLLVLSIFSLQSRASALWPECWTLFVRSCAPA